MESRKLSPPSFPACSSLSSSSVVSLDVGVSNTLGQTISGSNTSEKTDTLRLSGRQPDMWHNEVSTQLGQRILTPLTLPLQCSPIPLGGKTE